MRDFDLLIKPLAENEILCGCGDCLVDGIPVWDAMRYHLRILYMRAHGINYLNPQSKVKAGPLIRSVIRSFFQFIGFKKSCEYLFFSFPRVDRIGGVYLDKFTDPIIEVAGLKSYAIMEYGRGGVHFTPRLHNDRVIYLEHLVLWARIDAFFSGRFRKEHHGELEHLSTCIKAAYGDILSKKKIESRAVYMVRYVHRLAAFFKKAGGKCVIGPSRAYQALPFLAAREAGIRTLELQHGITYGETVMYSGFRSTAIVPDWFCEFGDNHPKDVYGINPERMVNIGWALFDYLKTVPSELEVKDKDVLVISAPTVSEKVLNAICILAQENRDSCFYFRPHPHEHLTPEQMDRIKNEPNITLQDNSINIAVVLQSFTYVVGENSTVLYEALSLGKRVGRLYFEGLAPLYLTEEERPLFWAVSDQTSFRAFLDAERGIVQNKSIYSPFDKDTFMQITNQ